MYVLFLFLILHSIKALTIVLSFVFSINLTRLLKEFDEAVNGSSKEHKPKAQGFFDGVKNFFDDLAK